MYKKNQIIHFVGIGGIGISALSKLALSKKFKIRGINDSESSETLDELRKKNIEIIVDDKLEVLPDTDLFVYSVAWEQRAPKLMKKIFQSPIPALNYFEALSLFTQKYPTIAVSGTHGKTTTTAMLKSALKNTDIDPQTIVGSIVTQGGSNYLEGKGNWFLIEACEYKRHFLNFQPKIAIITNIEEDHLDYYKDIDDILDAFLNFANQSDVVILNKSDENIQKILSKIHSEIIDYEPFIKEARKLNLRVLGEHNILNSAIVLALGNYLNINNEIIKKGLESFRGTWRRFEHLKTLENGVEVFADYAHHPTEIKTIIKTAMENFKKVFVIFEPHTFSRTQKLADEFGRAFNFADEVYITDIYPARENHVKGINANFLTQKIKKNNPNVWVKNLKIAFNNIKDQAKIGDTILILGAGDIYFEAKEIL